MDGINSYYELGKVRETYDGSGQMLSTHEYECPAGGCKTADDMVLKKITLVKARQDFEIQSASLMQQIEQAKFDALYRLAWQDEVARTQIKENVDAGISQINSNISSLESQRFVTIKQCHKGFLGFGKKCSSQTFEVPGIQSAISQLYTQRSDLIQTGENQLAALPGAIAAKKNEIEQATALKMAELVQQKDDFLVDILRHEMKPILSDFYRRNLGRDPSTAEVDTWVLRYKTEQAIDIHLLESELLASPERAMRDHRQATVIHDVRTFLESYVQASSETKAQLLTQLALTPAEVIAIEQADIDKILNWLEKQDRHFGESAFLSLKEMLASKGAAVSFETIGKESLLMDILTGTINPFSEGELVISVFALTKTAKIHGLDFSGVAYSFDDLKAWYALVCPNSNVACSLRMVAHVSGDHFVTITEITDTEVHYLESSKGANGEEVVVSHDQFKKVWAVDHDKGYLIVSQQELQPAQKLTDEKSKKIRGSFFFIDDLIFWAFVASFVFSVASYAVSFFSPTFGKILGYAALVSGIVGIVASVGNFVVQGLTQAFSSVAQQSTFAAIKQGFVSIGKTLLSPVKFVGNLIKNGFAFAKDAFSSGLESFGSGIMKAKDFVSTGAGAAIKNGTGEVIGHQFTFAQTAARNLITATIDFSVSKGLEGLGVDPRLSHLAGAFIGGGVTSLGVKGSSFFKSGLQRYIMQDVSEIGLHLGLAPPIINGISVATGFSLNEAFGLSGVNLGNPTALSLFPQFSQSIATGTIEMLSRSFGLDPRLASFLSAPLGTLVSGVTTGLLNHTGGIFDSIMQSLLSRETLGGIFSVGAQMTLDALHINDNVLASLGARAAMGLVSDFVNQHGKIDLFSSFSKIGTDFANKFVDPVLLPQLFASIREKGLAEGFNQYAASVLNRATVEDFVGTGLSFSQQVLVAMQNAKDADCGGHLCKSVSIAKNDKLITFKYFWTNGTFQIYGIQEVSDGSDRRFTFETDASGNISNVKVQVIDEKSGKITTNRSLTGDERDSVQFSDWDGNIFAEIAIDQNKQLQFVNYNLGVSGKIDQYGKLEFSYQVPELEGDFGQLIDQFNAAHLTPEQKSQVVLFTVGNGFWNKHMNKDDLAELSREFDKDMTGDLGRNGIPPAILYENGHVAVDGGGNILTTASLPITLYEETGIVGNGLKWMCETWFGCNNMKEEIITEMTHYMSVLRQNGFDPTQMNLVHFSHSGNFQPMIKAREDPRLAALNLKTMIVYEGPYVGDGVINNTKLDTIIRIHGTGGVSQGDAYVPFLEDHTFSGVNADGSSRVIKNYNIEILGAKHSDFSCTDGSSQDMCSGFINQQTNLFLRDLNLVANDRTKLERFLFTEATGVTFDNGIIKLNPDEYVSPNGARQ